LTPAIDTLLLHRAADALALDVEAVTLEVIVTLGILPVTSPAISSTTVGPTFLAGAIGSTLALALDTGIALPRALTAASTTAIVATFDAGTFRFAGTLTSLTVAPTVRRSARSSILHRCVAASGRCVAGIAGALIAIVAIGPPPDVATATNGMTVITGAVHIVSTDPCHNWIAATLLRRTEVVGTIHPIITGIEGVGVDHANPLVILDVTVESSVADIGVVLTLLISNAAASRGSVLRSGTLAHALPGKTLVIERTLKLIIANRSVAKVFVETLSGCRVTRVHGTFTGIVAGLGKSQANAGRAFVRHGAWNPVIAIVAVRGVRSVKTLPGGRVTAIHCAGVAVVTVLEITEAGRHYAVVASRTFTPVITSGIMVVKMPTTGIGVANIQRTFAAIITTSAVTLTICRQAAIQYLTPQLAVSDALAVNTIVAPLTAATTTLATAVIPAAILFAIGRTVADPVLRALAPTEGFATREALWHRPVCARVFGMTIPLSTGIPVVALAVVREVQTAELRVA